MAKRGKKTKGKMAEAPKAPEVPKVEEEPGDDILLTNEEFEEEFGPETAIDKPESAPEAPAPAAAPSPAHPDAPPKRFLRGEYETKHAHIYLIKPECYKEAGCKKVIIPKR